MSFCASATLPVSNSALITFCWLSENDTPERRNAVRPVSGSCSALPSWIAAPFKSPPIAVARLAVAFNAAGNTSPLILVNVSNSACAPIAASSEYVVRFCISLAIAESCPTDCPAAPAVDLTRASSCAIANCDSDVSSINFLKITPAPSTAPSFAIVPPSVAARLPVSPSLLPSSSSTVTAPEASTLMDSVARSAIAIASPQ